MVYGTDHSGVDLEGAAAEGVTVCHLPGYSTQAGAEAALRLALQLVAERPSRRELRSLQIGVAGMGRIGGRVAQLLARGLGAQVRYWSRARKPQAELGLRFAPLDELVAWSEACWCTFRSTPLPAACCTRRGSRRCRRARCWCGTTDVWKDHRRR